jgi:hypothetical protein
MGAEVVIKGVAAPAASGEPAEVTVERTEHTITTAKPDGTCGDDPQPF